MAIPCTVTLFDVVQAVSECATNDEEVVATMVHLVNSGRVLLCGTFVGARIDLYTLPSSPHTWTRPENSPGIAALTCGLLPLLESRDVTERGQKGGKAQWSNLAHCWHVGTARSPGAAILSRMLQLWAGSTENGRESTDNSPKQ
jgi:hypothetical protein